MQKEKQLKSKKEENIFSHPRDSVSGIRRGETTAPQFCPSDEESGVSREVRSLLNERVGFTLIELLVVVLIIGILAAVALPQYQKAVEKSRATQALTLLKSLGQAQEAYYMANGSYATKFEDLSIDLPQGWTAGGTFGTYQTNDSHTNGEWVIHLSKDPDLTGQITIGHPTGHSYQGAGLSYFPLHASYGGSATLKKRAGQIVCGEKKKYGTVFKKNDGDFCAKILHGNMIADWESGRSYQLSF